MGRWWSVVQPFCKKGVHHTSLSRKQITGGREKRKFKWKSSAGKQLISAISDWIEKSSNCEVQRDERISLAEKMVSAIASQGFSHRWCDCLNFQRGKWQSPPLSKPIYGRLLGERPVHIKGLLYRGSTNVPSQTNSIAKKVSHLSFPLPGQQFLLRPLPEKVRRKPGQWLAQLLLQPELKCSPGIPLSSITSLRKTWVNYVMSSC